MFTGIIEAIGSISSLNRQDEEWRITVAAPTLDLAELSLGDSIAVNGCCLTAVAFGADSFAADVSLETLRCTTLGKLQTGSRVNLELAMRANGRLGGHIVSGHVDGVGKLLSSESEGGSTRMEFEVPAELARYIAAKGSICIDGTSLTVNAVDGRRFIINVIPHTQSATIMGGYTIGQAVNLEVDVVARYLERLLSHEQEQDAGAGLTETLLREQGFTGD